MEIRFADLFCGIGGFRYGLEKASATKQESGENRQTTPSIARARNRRRFQSFYRCVWANDNDRYACQIYRRHWNDRTLHEGDIRTVNLDAIPEHDLLCAGFPCQSFSVAGKRKGFEDTRGTLFFEICRVLRAKRPSYILLENVKGLLSSDDGETFRVILTKLDDLGYDLQWQVLNSKNFGVPQNRERVFIVGHFRGQPRPKVFPVGETNETYPEGYEAGNQIPPAGQDIQPANRHTESTSRDSRLYPTPDEDTGQETMIYDIYNQQLRANQELAGALKGEGIAETSLGTALIIQAGIRTKGKPRFYSNEIPAMAQAYGTAGGNVPMIANAVDVDGYLRFGQRPRDETGKPQLLPIGYRRIRRLTPLECERLQSFPDGWTGGISDTQRYKCLGNAVTVNVIQHLGERLMEME